jgi:cell filamentation protein
MSNPSSEDKKYCYPGTSILKNKLNIQDADTLDTMERKLTAIRLTEMKQKPITGTFDFDHLKAIHKFIFQDLYAFAGEVRTVGISKGFVFAQPSYIDEEANRLFKKLKNENFLNGLNKDRFCERLAYYKTELNVLHPFREGNGRSTREFIESLARYNGFTIDFSNISKERYMDAMIHSPHSEIKLIGLLKESVHYLDSKVLHKSVIEQYTDQCPAIKYISFDAAKAIDELNCKQGTPISLKDIKNLYQEAGKTLECNSTPDNINSFNELKLIIDELKHAQLNHMNENSKSKVQFKILKNSIEHDISG